MDEKVFRTGREFSSLACGWMKNTGMVRMICIYIYTSFSRESGDDDDDDDGGGGGGDDDDDDDDGGGGGGDDDDDDDDDDAAMCFFRWCWTNAMYFDILWHAGIRKNAGLIASRWSRFNCLRKRWHTHQLRGFHYTPQTDILNSKM